MPRDWESTFRNWSKPSSDTEEQKCENAERMIRDAIRESELFSGKTIEIFPQGSYRNNTNVRQDSDVDICVRCMDTFFYEIPNDAGFTKENAGISDSNYTYLQFKNEVEQALVAKFGRQAVTRRNKAFDVHANSYRVDADVVACFEHRRYTYRGQDGRYNYLSGTEFLPDNGGYIINWPHQNYENGVIKNRSTGNRFKYITRALKRLRNEMVENGIAVAELVPSYLIECLVWNVPNYGFSHDRYIDDMRYVIAYTFNGTISYNKCQVWGEINELKYLFRPSQPWTEEKARTFLDASWRYIGFE